MKRFAFALVAALSAALFAAPPALSGNDLAMVNGWEYGMETISFGEGTAFSWTRVTGDSSSAKEGTWFLDVGMYGPEISFQYREREDGAETVTEGSESYDYAWSEGSPSVLVLYTRERIAGIYTSNADSFLYAATYAASSELTETIKGRKITYLSGYLGDPDFSKFWAEGAKGTGTGSWFSASLESDDGTDLVRCRPAFAVLANGFPMNPDMFAANSRAKTLEITPDKGKAIRIQVEDTFAPTIYRLAMDRGVRSIRSTILEAAKGMKYDDLCVSKFFVIGRYGD